MLLVGYLLISNYFHREARILLLGMGPLPNIFSSICVLWQNIKYKTYIPLLGTFER